jgi:hypothetical protein
MLTYTPDPLDGPFVAGANYLAVHGEDGYRNETPVPLLAKGGGAADVGHLTLRKGLLFHCHHRHDRHNPDICRAFLMTALLDHQRGPSLPSSRPSCSEALIYRLFSHHDGYDGLLRVYSKWVFARRPRYRTRGRGEALRVRGALCCRPLRLRAGLRGSRR